jgi:hypothetical protein
VVGCEGQLWPRALPAATQLVVCLEGADPRADGYHELLDALLGEVSRQPHVDVKRRSFLVGPAPALLPRIAKHVRKSPGCPMALRGAEPRAAAAAAALPLQVCLQALLPQLGLMAVRHFSRLMPLLLEWLHSPRPEARLQAARCLELLLQHCWPRMGAHAGVLRAHLQRAGDVSGLLGASREQRVQVEETVGRVSDLRAAVGASAGAGA